MTAQRPGAVVTISRMPTSRRRFMQTAAAAVAAPMLARAAEPAATTRAVSEDELNRVLDAPVLTLGFLKAPVTVESIELLRNSRTFIVRSRSADGVEAITVPN